MFGCFEEAWAGGVLFLFRLVEPLCDASLCNALAAFVATLLRERNGADATLDTLPMSPGPLPPLPEVVCAACRTAVSGKRLVCVQPLPCRLLSL
jgi:hypothetical protein